MLNNAPGVRGNGAEIDFSECWTRVFQFMIKENKKTLQVND